MAGNGSPIDGIFQASKEGYLGQGSLSFTFDGLIAIFIIINFIIIH